MTRSEDFQLFNRLHAPYTISCLNESKLFTIIVTIKVKLHLVNKILSPVFRFKTQTINNCLNPVWEFLCQAPVASLSTVSDITVRYQIYLEP